ncbi:TRIO and F-actin-binding protein isoform X3 [Hyla sarda]|nr:TRIO and F-actin-binding protein isoform X3 [Hyla sarda]XP_056379891.1 TRIO and F-actin-binding protein isoform X3 [Hyla sarda]
MQFLGNRGSSATKSQQRGDNSVQRSFTPVTSVKEERSCSSIKTQQRSNSPARSQQRSSSPANFLTRGSSSVPSQQRSYAPVRCQQSSSPVRLQQRSSSAVWSQQTNSSPVHYQQRSSSPSQIQQSSSSPVRLYHRSSSIGSQQISSSPPRSQQRSSSSVSSLQGNSSPLKTQHNDYSHLRSPQGIKSPTEFYQRTSTYVREEQRCASPVRIQQRSASPVRTQGTSKFGTQQRSTSPARTQLRSTSPARTPLRSTSPARTQFRSISPARTPLRSTSPARTQFRSTSPARTPLRSTSPARTQLRSTSPDRTPLRSTSPARTQLRSTSPARTPLRSTSPARTQLRSTSPARTPLRSTSPARTQLRSTSPARTPRSTSPARTQLRSTSPARTPRSTSPARTQLRSTSSARTPRSTSPVRTHPRSTSPARTPLRSTSPARTQLRSTSPARTPLRSTSPARTQLRSISPARTPPRSTSPARSQSRLSSAFREQQKSASSVYLKRSPSPSPSHQRTISDVGHTWNVSRRSSAPKTVSTESIHKTGPQKGQVDVNQYRTTFSSHGPSRAGQDPTTLGVSHRLTSSTSSLDSECSQRGNRAHYTAMADIPRAKRLRPDLATLNMKGRKRSPGQAEIERIFGQERRTADALEAFQALEAGLIESLSGKYSLMEQRRARRQSTPCLYPEESVRMRQELQMRRASLHPPPRTDMGFSGSKVTETRSGDPFSYHTGAQGRKAFKEPEWMNRDKILRPVGAQDKKEGKLDKNTELAWKNRETFLKSTPTPVEASHEHQGSTNYRSRENSQASISRTSAEPTILHFGSSQYQKHEKSQKVEQQYKPSPINNPQSHYSGSNHPHHSQHRPSYGSLLENAVKEYTQANSIQEAKNVGWSQYKPAGPLSCHTPEPQKQQFLGFSEIENVPLKTELKAAGTQTDGEMSKNGSAPCVLSPQESNNIKSQAEPLLSDTKQQTVRDPSLLRPESECKAYTPPETTKRELQRPQTPSSNSSSSQKPYAHSEEPNPYNRKEVRKSSASEIIRKDSTGLSSSCSPSKTPSRTESSVYDSPEWQPSKTEESRKGMTELNYSEDTYEEKNVQQSHPPPSNSSPEQADSDPEPKYHPGVSLYKPAGPLSCYRREPQSQILVDWYSGTETPLSKVVLKPTRSIIVTSESAKQNDSNDSQDVETLKESRSQNDCPAEDRSRPHTPSEHLKPETAERQVTPVKTFQKDYPNSPSPEHIFYDWKGLDLADASEVLHNESLHYKTSNVNDNSSLSDTKTEKPLTKEIRHFQHYDYSPADSNTAEYEEACDTDMYLNTMGKHVKPDLLNFKKGWMSLLDANGEWKKHWFVLTDSSLRYYRDSNAEEADELDGEIDLRTCTDVPEFSVQRNYGFQIHTNEGIFTLSAMTSGIRRNWIEALRKNVHPVSIPDVTKLSESNKENTLVSTRLNQRPEELRLSSEVRTRKVELAGSRHGSFDYVELSPLSPGEERDQKSEERRRWFEAPPGGDSSSARRITQTPLTEELKQRLSEDIEAKWKELERLPLRETKQTSLTCLLGGSRSKTGGENTAALEKQIQSLKMQLEKAQKGGGETALPHGYISQESCEHSLSQMEKSHKQLLSELQRHHEWEIQRLRQEKDQLLAEEAAATASVIESIRAAHKEELQREVEKARTFQHGGSSTNEMLRRQHQSEMDALRRELQTLSERYSQKCLEIGSMNQAASERERELQRCQQEGQELLRQNQELNNRLSEEIAKLRSFMAGNGPSDGRLHAGERNTAELEVLLRVKENELQYLRKEVSCLRDDLQNMQKDKRYASEKYKDIYVELNNIKSRSEREIDQLKEHLRLAMAALREEAAMRNSVGE